MKNYLQTLILIFLLSIIHFTIQAQSPSEYAQAIDEKWQGSIAGQAVHVYFTSYEYRGGIYKVYMYYGYYYYLSQGAENTIRITMLMDKNGRSLTEYDYQDNPQATFQVVEDTGNSIIGVWESLKNETSYYFNLSKLY